MRCYFRLFYFPERVVKGKAEDENVELFLAELFCAKMFGTGWGENWTDSFIMILFSIPYRTSDWMRCTVPHRLLISIRLWFSILMIKHGSVDQLSRQIVLSVLSDLLSFYSVFHWGIRSAKWRLGVNYQFHLKINNL
jgi:hypothetical protein